MTSLNQVWRCEICGNLVEILHTGSDSLVCCGQAMNLLKPKMQDIGKEKHVPIIEKIKESGNNMVIVKVGFIPHPMEEKHYIEFIELVVDGRIYRKFLKPEDKPEAEFCLVSDYSELSVREYCNVHGFWKN